MLYSLQMFAGLYGIGGRLSSANGGFFSGEGHPLPKIWRATLLPGVPIERGEFSPISPGTGWRLVILGWREDGGEGRVGNTQNAARKEHGMATKCRWCGSTSYGSGCIHGPRGRHERWRSGCFLCSGSGEDRIKTMDRVHQQGRAPAAANGDHA